MESHAGFIQAKINFKVKRNIFGSRIYRNTLNFMVAPLYKQQSTITLNINCEELTDTGSGGNTSCFYKDLGISENAEDYTFILKSLQEAIENF